MRNYKSIQNFYAIRTSLWDFEQKSPQDFLNDKPAFIQGFFRLG